MYIKQNIVHKQLQISFLKESYVNIGYVNIVRMDEV